MGLFETTKVVYVPVLMVVSNPIGGILMVVIAIVFWQLIFTVVAALTAIGLLIALLGWFKGFSRDFSNGAKFIGYFVIIAAVITGFTLVNQKINGSDLSTKEAEAIESEKFAKEADVVQERIESNSDREVKEAIETEAIDSGGNKNDLHQNLIQTGETKTRETTSTSSISSTASEGFYSDGVNYFYEYNDTLYQANDIVFKPNSKTPEKLSFYYFVGKEILQKTVVFDESGKLVKSINDDIVKHAEITKDPRFYTACAVLLLGISLVTLSLLKGRSKKEVKKTDLATSDKLESIDKLPETIGYKAPEVANRVRSKVLEEDGHLSIVFEPSISKEQVEQLRLFVSGLPKNNHKKIKINGEGENIRTLDHKEVKLIIDFLETMSIFTKNKSKLN